MNNPSLESTTPPSVVSAGKLTRHTLAAHLAVSLRYVDELTRKGVLPYYKIGKSIRYDLAEVETALRERFHVRAKARRSTHSIAA
jgi:excisionase family DNA binding protein